MVRIITAPDLRTLIKKVSLKTFMLELIAQLESDFSRWDQFQKSPRHATHVPGGVIELMPISDRDYYAFKCVNGHPGNPKQGKQTVVATGQLSLVATGYPILLSEMTLLTALRTAATSALASKYLAKKGTQSFGIIGTGAQAEFQLLAHHFALNVREIFYYDIDLHAMEKFAANLKPFDLHLHRCTSAKEVAEKSDLITTATAQKGHAKILESGWIKRGCHINGIGGDCPGKTELDPTLLMRAKIVIEFLEQSLVEGEIQQTGASKIYAELWELVSGRKKARESEEEITLFDSVGFALEDYSALQLVYKLAEKYKIGHLLEMVPHPEDPKNLFGALQ